MNRLRKNKRKGFTLVEIIVVLVIIAVLMAALTPVMIGWIREARDTAMLANARTGLTAAQSLVADNIGRGVTPLNADPTAMTTQTGTTFANLTQGVPNAATAFQFVTYDAGTGTITRLVYAPVAGGRCAEWTQVVGGVGAWAVLATPPLV